MPGPRVADALAAAGATGEVVELAAGVRTAALAAAALGVEVGAIANSLVFDADGEPLLVLTSGAHRVDTAQGRRAGRRERAAPGQPGLRPPPPARRSAASPRSGTRRRCDAGRRGCSRDVRRGLGRRRGAAVVFPTTYEELVRITGGTPAEVA